MCICIYIYTWLKSQLVSGIHTLDAFLVATLVQDVSVLPNFGDEGREWVGSSDLVILEHLGLPKSNGAMMMMMMMMMMMRTTTTIYDLILWYCVHIQLPPRSPPFGILFLPGRCHMELGNLHVPCYLKGYLLPSHANCPIFRMNVEWTRACQIFLGCHVCWGVTLGGNIHLSSIFEASWG